MLKTLSALAFALMVVGLLWQFYWARALFSWNPAVIAIQVAAFAVIIWARVTFGIRSFHATANPTAGGIVSTGPYRYLRHPIYSSVIYLTAAGLAGHFSLSALAAFSLIVVGGVGRMLMEEHLLVERYPEYRDYMRRTKRIIPFVL